MPHLPKFTVSHNERREKWELRNDKTDQIIKSSDTKEDITAGGVLQRALGSNGGSVKIQKLNGRIQEERTFPPSADPRRSKG